jgi:hypothetical protein
MNLVASFSLQTVCNTTRAAHALHSSNYILYNIVHKCPPPPFDFGLFFGPVVLEATFNVTNIFNFMSVKFQYAWSLDNSRSLSGLVKTG